MLAFICLVNLYACLHLSDQPVCLYLSVWLTYLVVFISLVNLSGCIYECGQPVWLYLPVWSTCLVVFTCLVNLYAFLYQSDQPISINIQLTGLNQTSTPPSHHGFHVHNSGDLGNKCNNSGGHYNPDSVTHGGPQDIVRYVASSAFIDRVSLVMQSNDGCSKMQ